MATRLQPVLRASLMLTAVVLLMMAGVAPSDVRAAVPSVRCVTTTGSAPSVATASGCAFLYNTITAAVNAAGAGDTIYVFADAGATATSPTTYTESASVAIGTNLTIIGVGAVAIDGGNTHGVIGIASATVTLIGLTIQHGHTAAAGAGIVNGGTLTLINSTVANNSAGNGSNPGQGGGILNNFSTLTLINATVANNTAAQDGGGISFGGGIFTNSGTLTLIHSTVTGNTAQGMMGAGGGIDSGGSPTITLTNSLVAGNTQGGGNDVNSPATNNNNVLGGVTPNATMASAHWRTTVAPPRPSASTPPAPPTTTPPAPPTRPPRAPSPPISATSRARRGRTAMRAPSN